MSVKTIDDAIELSKVSLKNFDREKHILKVEKGAFKYISCQEKSQGKSDLKAVVSYINEYCPQLQVDYSELQDAINKVNDAVRSYNQRHKKQIFKVFSEEIANAKKLTKDVKKQPNAMQGQAVLVKAIEKIEDEQDLHIVLELVTTLRAHKHKDGPLLQVKEVHDGKNALQALLEVPDLEDSGTLFAAVVDGFEEDEIRDSQLLINALLQKKTSLVEILFSPDLNVDFSVTHHGKPAFMVARDCGFTKAHQVLLNPKRTQAEILAALSDTSTPPYLIKFLIAMLTQTNKIAFYRTNPQRLKQRAEEPKAIQSVRHAMVVFKQKEKFPDWALKSEFLSRALASVECEKDFNEIVLFCKELTKTQLKGFVVDDHALHRLASMPATLPGYDEVRDMLFDRVADFNVEDSEGKSIFFYALVSGNGPLILKLCEKQVAMPAKLLFEALQMVETVEGYQAILTLLNMNLLDKNHTDAGNTVLHALVKLSPEISDARELIEKLKDIDLSKNDKNKSPIYVAFRRKRHDVLTALLEKDHCFDHVEDKFLFDVLKKVQSAEDVEMMLAMIDRAQVRLKDHSEGGKTLLHAALELDPNIPGIARLLQEVAANGQNPLEIAKNEGKLDHLEKLAEAYPALLQNVDVSALELKFQELKTHTQLHLLAKLFEYIVAGNAYAARPILESLDEDSKNALQGALYEAYIAQHPNASTILTFGADKFQDFKDAALVNQDLNALMKRAIVIVLRKAYEDPSKKDMAKALLLRLHPEYQTLPLHFAVFLKDNALVDQEKTNGTNLHQEKTNGTNLHAKDARGRTAFAFAQEIGLERPERLDPDQTLNALRAAFSVPNQPVAVPTPAPEPEPKPEPAPVTQPKLQKTPQAPSRFRGGGFLTNFFALRSTSTPSQPKPRKRSPLEALTDISTAIQSRSALPEGTRELYQAIRLYQEHLNGEKIDGQAKWSEFVATNYSQAGFNDFITKAIDFYLFKLWRDAIVSQDFDKLQELNALFSEEQKRAIYFAIETRERTYNPNANIDGRAKYEEFLQTRLENPGFNNFILEAYSDLRSQRFPK